MKYILLVCMFLSVIAMADTHNYTSTQNMSTGGDVPGAPTDGDRIAITGGDIAMDLQMAGSGLIASTVTAPGRIVAPTTPGTYTLRLNGSLSGTGCLYLNGGTDIDLPDNIVINIVVPTYGSSVIILTGNHDIRCTDPTVTHSTLKLARSAGLTTIYVNDTLDELWVAPKYIRIDNINKIMNSEEYTIVNTGIDGTGQYITISPGLTSAKVIGAYVFLATRNIQFTGSKVSLQAGFGNPRNSYLKLGVRNFVYGGSTTGGANTITGGVWAGNTTLWSNGSLMTVDNIIATGNTFGFGNPTYSTFTNSIFSGGTGLGYAAAITSTDNTYIGNNNAVTTSNNFTSKNDVFIGNNGSIVGCRDASILTPVCMANTYTISQSNGVSVIGATYTNNTYAYASSFNCTLVDAVLSGNTYFFSSGVSGTFYNLQVSGGISGYNSDYKVMGVTSILESFRHLNIDDNYYAFMLGGTITSDFFVYPTNHTFSYKHSTANVDYPCYKQISQIINPGQRLGIAVYSKCATTTWTIDPKFEIVNKTVDPLTDPTNLALATIVAPDTDTNWHRALLTYANTSDQPMFVYVRAIAQDASKIFYSQMDIITPTKAGVRSCGK